MEGETRRRVESRSGNLPLSQISSGFISLTFSDRDE